MNTRARGSAAHMDPTVTVIIPAFNSAPYLRATLESVRAQTFQNWELILSDDGSTDDTVSIAETFAREDPRIRVLRNPAGRNPAVRRNDGMRQGRGEYFAFLDSDDLWLPEKLQAQLDAMRQIAKPGVCYTFTEEFSSDPTLELRGWPKFIPPPDKESQYQLSLLTYNWASPSTMMVSREFVDQFGLLPEEPMLAKNDYQDWLLRSLKLRPMLLIPKPLTRYHVHQNSLSTRPDPIPMWRRYLEVRRVADARGDLSPALRRRANSVCWLRRAEEEVISGQKGWRRSYLKSVCWDPLNSRRWPNLLALALPHKWMRSMQNGMRKIKYRAVALLKRGSGKVVQR